MTEPELVRGDGVSLVPVPPGGSLDDLPALIGGLTAGRGWPHAGTAPALAFAAAGGWTWLIVDESGAVVGDCGTKDPPVDGRVEIGYGLAGPSRGRGLGGRAIDALVGWLSALPEVKVVTAHAAVDNQPSRRLLERLGFRLSGAGDGEEVEYSLDLAGQASETAGKVNLSNDDDDT